MAYIDTQVHIEPEEYWHYCSSGEKEELAKIVVQDGYTSELLFNPSTYTEQEIVRLFQAIWDSKNFVQQKHIDGIFKDLREKKVI